MTFEEAWLKLAEKKPLLLDSDVKVEITNDNLKRLLEQFYEVGKTAGTNTTSPFDRIFGGRYGS